MSSSEFKIGDKVRCRGRRYERWSPYPLSGVIEAVDSEYWLVRLVNGNPFWVPRDRPERIVRSDSKPSLFNK